MPEIPALYEVAKWACHSVGLPWTDPRTGRLYPAPKKITIARKPRRKYGPKRAR